MRENDFAGPGGLAWDLLPLPKKLAAYVGIWTVNRRVNQWWLVTVIHLRDEPGLPPPYKQYEGATHELGIYRIDGEFDLDAWDNDEPGKVYINPGFNVQFHASDENARVVVGSVAMMICWGWSPTKNDDRWRGAILAMVERERTGGMYINPGAIA